MALFFKPVLALFAGISLCFFGAQSAYAATSKQPASHTPGSSYTINYDDWNYVLANTVLKTGKSDRRPASKARLKNTSTRIKHGNKKATGLEGNRVLFHEFDDGHRALLLAIRKDLEAVPDTLPLREFNRTEQLAYWLNLHNVAVMLEVSKQYPVRSIKRIAAGKNNIWSQQNMVVGDRPMSIADIEDHVTANWNNPLVLYGFYMGAVGGPNIRSTAYTADTLTEQLTENATEFVNSLRGVRFWGDKAHVSSHYNLGARYFPDFEKDLQNHMIRFADAKLARRLTEAKTFKAKSYDWGIADLKNGDSYSGSSYNTNPGALAYFIYDPNTYAAPYLSTGITTNPDFMGYIGDGIPHHVAALFTGLKKRSERRRHKVTVTIEEFLEGAGSRVSVEP